MQQEETYLTVKEAALRLGLNPQTIYRNLRAGILSGVHVGKSIRIPATAIAEPVRPASVDPDELDRTHRVPTRLIAWQEAEFLDDFDFSISRATDLPNPYACDQAVAITNWNRRRVPVEPFITNAGQPGPRNECRAYRLKANEAFGSKGLVCLASCITRLDAVYRDGYDNVPLTAPELIALLNWGSLIGSLTDSLVVWGIASTSGWGEDARRLVTGGEGEAGLLLPALTICLVDSVRQEVCINSGDLRIGPYLPLFDGRNRPARTLRMDALVEQTIRDATKRSAGGRA